MTPTDPISLAHWRRTVAELYAAVRRAEDGERACAQEAFRAARDELFRRHPQSPLDQPSRQAFTSLEYYPYDPAWRLIGVIDTDVGHVTQSVDLAADGPLRYTRVAQVRFVYADQLAELSVYWIEGYGGGLFLPFLDQTNTNETYGGGRYLYDTIKGADLGIQGNTLVLDFNYAYNPSCAYDYQWTCPLAPKENRLPFPVRAGETSFTAMTKHVLDVTG
jgi:uncharacterized protein (DUF1684 family)